MARPSLLRALAAALLLGPALLAQDDADRIWATFDPDGAWDRVEKRAEGGEPAPVTTGSFAGSSGADDCGSGTLIPGDTVTFSPTPFSTFFSGLESCEVAPSCASGISNTVWYSYTPDQDGFVTLDTFGSSYDTVLAVYDGCPVLVGGLFCVQPDELACSNDYFFGTTSQLGLAVTAGETYRIQVGADAGSFGGTLDFDLRYAPANDSCATATTILGEAYAPDLLSTHNATTDVCEAEESCEFNGVGVSNSVWYRYVPPCDGFVSVNTNGADYDTVLSIHDGCGEFVGIDIPCDLPAELACSDDEGTGTASQLLDVPVVGGQEILIKVADYNPTPGGGRLDFHFVFTQANPPLADLAMPSDFDCVCGFAGVFGTADVGGTGGPLEWTLEWTTMGSDSWTPVAIGVAPVVDGALASWDTTSLAQGYYLLRLTVTNACGATSSDTEVVFVDRQLDAATLNGPLTGNVVGGIVCVEGTARDTCFQTYAVDVGASGGGSFTPVGSSPYATQVVQNPLVPGGWDTSGLPDGLYDLRLTVTDDCGASEEVVERIELDNTNPVAQISSPRNCLVSTGVVTFRGTASDANLSHWLLQVTGGSFGDWTTIAQGEQGVLDDVLGSLDLGALPKCAYTVRLLVFDETTVNCDDTRFSEALVSISNGAAIQTGSNPGAFEF